MAGRKGEVTKAAIRIRRRTLRFQTDVPRLLVPLPIAWATLLGATCAMADPTLPPGLVYLRDVAPTIRQDMKYASADNFTGSRLPGYGAPECILREEVAKALARAQVELEKKGYSLKVYDCYRPVRAVRAMRAWTENGTPETPTKRFFPRVHKSYLFALRYIATRSNHSLGKAVDLTLVPLPLPRQPATAFDANASYGSCIEPDVVRAPDDGIEMGTGFDCFDVKSHTAARDISADARHNRTLLLNVMEKQGFSNYAREWWHFDYGRGGGGPYDFPIAPH